MANKQGTNQIVDAFIGDKLIEARYTGAVKYFDAYTELTNSLPLSFDARAAGALKDYRVYGSSTGSGEVVLGIQLDEPLRGLGDIKDTLDLSTGVLTRRIGVEVLDGVKGQIPDGNTTRYFFRHISDLTVVEPTDTQIISHYVYAPITTTNSELGCRVLKTSSNSTRIAIRSPNANLDTTEKYRAFYASEYANGRPVTAYYVLANPVTEQVEVPPGLTGTIEGYLTQSGTPTESNPIYPEANGVELPNGKYEVYVYKIPLLNTSGVTENLWDYELSDGINLNLRTGLPEESSTRSGTANPISVTGNTYTITYDSVNDSDIKFIYSVFNGNTLVRRVSTKTGGIYLTSGDTIDTSDGDALYFCFWNSDSSDDVHVVPSDISNIMFVEGSTAPSEYIPHRYTSNYDLFIGDSKLGVTEYLDFSEQKIYKDVSGTLTPTDPPAPLPAIQAYKGENTLSSTETVGNVTVKGRISEVTP